MKRNEMIKEILKKCSDYELEEFEEMSDKDVELAYYEVLGSNDMFPNGRDFEAEDEEF